MPAETPQGVPESVVFAKFSGLKNTVSRERLHADELAVAVNVDFDDAGQPHRRRGRRRVATGYFHSLWTSNDGTVYGVKDGSFGIIEPDYFFTDLGRTVGDSPLCYEQVGDEVFFSGEYASGVVTHPTGVVEDWGPSQSFWWSPVDNPSDTLPAIKGKLLGAPPQASAMVYYNGRIYIAAGKMLWATVFQQYHHVDKTRGFIQFEDDITMVLAVSDGLYVGTRSGVYFMQGGSFEKLQRRRVMDSGVLSGSGIPIPAELANPPQEGIDKDEPMSVSAAFFTTNGFCVGQESGKCTNLTEGNFFFPTSLRATAFFRRQDGMNHYVVCLAHGGDPTSNARFGYVDVALIRDKDHWVTVSDTAKATEQYS